MDCEKFDRVVLDLLYGELDELTAAAARRHVEHCRRCKEILQGLRATRQVGALALVEPTEGLRERILLAEQRVRARAPLSRRLGRGVSILAHYAMRPQLAMAAVFLLMVGSSLVFLRGRSEVARAPTAAEVAGATDDVPLAEPEALAAAPAALSPAAQSAPEAAPRQESPEFERAVGAYTAGRYTEAQRGFEAIVDRGGPEAPAAALQAALAARGAGGCAVAASRFEAVGVRFPNTPPAHEALWQAAACHRSLGRVEDARRNYRALLGVTGWTERAEGMLAALDDAPVALSAGRGRAAQADRKTAARAPSKSAPAAAAPAGTAPPPKAAPKAAPPTAAEKAY